jgi:hypothetical protein
VIDILLIIYLPIAILAVPALIVMLYLVFVWIWKIQRQCRFSEPEPKRHILLMLPSNIVRWYGRNLPGWFVRQRSATFKKLSTEV